MPDDFSIRTLHKANDASELADLLYVSLNHWHQTHGRSAIFTQGPEACEYFAEIYEALDPGCCVVAEHGRTRRLMGACFYHPRQTHVSVGIMAVHPNYAGMGVARTLLKFITDVADRAGVPTRLVSSAINLDSFSLYNRAGFVPWCVYQDMWIDVPADGLPALQGEAGLMLRDANAADDVPAMVNLEFEVSGIRREKDYRFFLDPRSPGTWHTSVAYRDGRLNGFLVSLRTARGASVGPGVCLTAGAAKALLHRELNVLSGRGVLALVPSNEAPLTRALYGWGARNVEIHLAQVRGRFGGFNGITLPTFMPETG